MMNSQSIPLVCILPQPELAARRQLVMETIFTSVQRHVELEDGYAFHFSADFPLQTLTDFIGAERACCRFLTFELVAAPQSLVLSLRGPTGTKSFLDNMLNKQIESAA